MRKIKVSDSTWEKILEKLKKISDRHRIVPLFYTYKPVGDDKKKSWHYRGPFFHKKFLGSKQLPNGEYVAETKLEFVNTSRFIRISAHKRTEAEDYFSKSFVEKYGKTYIGLILGPDSVMSLSEKDSVRFLPFGLGFVTYEKNKLWGYSSTNFFLTFGKIKDLEEEIKKQDAEIDEYAKEMDEIEGRHLGHDEFGHYDSDDENEDWDSNDPDWPLDESERFLLDDDICPDDLLDDEFGPVEEEAREDAPV